MKKTESKSRALRRKLLIALITSLLTVMMICTMIFERVYKQTAQNVNDHSMKLADNTISVIDDAYYQQFLSSLQIILRNYVNEYCYELDKYEEGIDKDFRTFLANQTSAFFYDPEQYVYFMYFDGVMTTYTMPDISYADHIMNKASRELSKQIAEAPEYFNGTTNLMDYIDSTRYARSGMYTKKGKGYVIAWDNMNRHSDYDICVGLMMTDINGYVEPLKEQANIQSALLMDQLNTIFRKYIYIMLGSMGGILIIFIIISAIISKKLSDPVISEHDMLVNLNNMKTTFLSDVSHELKTPLAALSGYAQNAEIELNRNGDPEQVTEKLKRISSESNRMALMVTQILDATRIEEGRLVLDRMPCNLDELVRETIETYFAVLNKNNNKLALRIPLDFPAVDADPSRLQRVFVNLVSNALKHTRNGTIVIKAEEEEGWAKVTVRDTGSGISAEDMPHIWERYYKGKHSETGTGLGLFICKFIVESHGGKIWAESEPGKGTAFMFTLPLSDKK